MRSSSPLQAYNFAIIYCARNTVTGDRYIGRAVDGRQRGKDHYKEYEDVNARTSAPRFHATLRKYGWDAFEWTMLERIDDLATIQDRETYWMDVIDACNPDRGYNDRRCRLGIIWQQAQKVREIVQICPDTGKPVRLWESASTAARSVICSRGNIVDCCSKFHQRTYSRATAAGFVWRYADEPLPDPCSLIAHIKAERYRNAGYKVLQISKTGDIVQVWSAIRRAAKALHIGKSTIIKACRDITQTAGGYHWCHADQASPNLLTIPANT